MADVTIDQEMPTEDTCIMEQNNCYDIILCHTNFRIHNYFLNRNNLEAIAIFKFNDNRTFQAPLPHVGFKIDKERTYPIIKKLLDNSLNQPERIELRTFLKTQDKKNSFKNIRQVLADSKITDFSDLFRLLFDTVDDWGRGHVAECILTLSQYQQSDAIVVDKEINVMAMFVEIIGIIK